MISFWRIFWLEFVAWMRSKALAMLVVASVLWVLGFRHLVTGDGTAAGERELYVHFSLGGVFALLVVTLLASATGSLARERAEKRLQLTMVRPVRHFSIVFGKVLAHVAVGALALAVACAVLLGLTDPSVPCSHVLSPVMPAPQEEAKVMYEEFMKDPSTPEAVRRTKKPIVLRLLAQRALDRYETIQTNSTGSWTFDGLAGLSSTEGLAVRMRFTNQYEMRQDVRGEFVLGDFRGAVSNVTQAVLTVPLTARTSDRSRGPGVLAFENQGRSALMLRPRRDINLLLPADAFGWNLLRTYVALLAILALVISAGTFLSAGLGRPVALFVAFVALIVSEMSPSVVEQYPDELESNAVDRMGLCIARFAADVTRPVSAASPLETLSADECVEVAAVWRLVAVDLLLAPVLLSLLAAFVLPHKQEDA